MSNEKTGTQLKPSFLFSDGMVLQAEKPIHVFGDADGMVTVTFRDYTVTAGSVGGHFDAVLPAFPCGGPYTMTISCGACVITYQDVMVGEVYLCSGQSNMQFLLSESNTPTEDYCRDPLMRMFECPRPEVDRAVAGHWVAADPQNDGEWSAIGYHLARTARKNGKCAVGIIACSQGASNIQSWVDEHDYLGTRLELPTSVMHPDASHERYLQWNQPGLLYHSMLERIAPYTVRAAVFYQGESNASVAEGERYVDFLSRMISRWRTRFADAAMPFVLVQLADFIYQDTEGWHAIQKAQADAPACIPGVQCVVCRDICENDMIHPVSKQTLAERIFRALDA